MDYIESLQKARRRRKQVLAYRKQGWTYKKIGQKLGITPQRAWKIADEEKAIINKFYGVLSEK